MNSHSNSGMSHHNRIKLLIERTFNTQEEQARILDTVRMLDKKSRTDAGPKPIANSQPDVSYVYGDQPAKENLNQNDVQLFDGQMSFSATQPLPAQRQSSLNQPQIVTPIPSSSVASSSRPSSTNSLDALLGSSSSVSSQGSNFFRPPALSAAPGSTAKPANTNTNTKSASSSSSSSSRTSQARASLPPRATNQPDIATMFPNKKRAVHVTEPIVISDFAGIETVCRNAGASRDSLDAVLQMILLDGPCDVVLSAIYNDCKTSHHSVTNKYCTASVQCSNWFCTCDRHIRAVESTEALIGVAFIIYCSQVSATQAVVDEEPVYFLPLVSCMEPTASQQQQYHQLSASAGSVVLPLDCSSTVEERWSALLSILSAESVRKIIFNCQLFLFPVMHYIQQRYHQHQQEQHHYQAITESCASLWDPKISSYLISSDIGEEQLELYCLLGKHRVHCKHLSSNNTHTSVATTSSDAAEGIAVASEGRLTKLFEKLREELLCLHRLTQIQETEMTASEGLANVFTNIEMPVVALLSSMESAGIHCSVEYLHTMHHELSGVIGDLESTARDMISSSSGGGGGGRSAESFNLASPEQVAHILYGHFKLPSPGGTTSGAKHASTSEEALKKIRHLHPMVDVVLQFRAANKLLTTYCGTSLTQFIHAQTDNDIGGSGGVRRCIHANWNQTIVRTGRLSCSKPNLQNIPNQQKVGHLDVNIREALHAPPGCVLVSADYSQIEMRVLAHLCQDPSMTALFHRDKDIYRQLAGRIMNKPPERVTPEERDKAKVVCLGVLYGMGPQATAAKLGIDVAAANQITHSFFNHFKKMKTWISHIKSQAKQHGYIRTLLGRRRYLPDIHSTDRVKSSLGERQAVNSVIQGTASDVIKYAMINVDRALSRINSNRSNGRGVVAALVMQIHDELIYSFPVDYIDNQQKQLTPDSRAALNQFVQLLHQKMSDEVVSMLGLKVPLLVNVKWGRSWGSLTDYVPSAASGTTFTPPVAATVNAVYGGNASINGGAGSAITSSSGEVRGMTSEEEEEQLLRMMDSVEAQYEAQLKEGSNHITTTAAVVDSGADWCKTVDIVDGEPNGDFVYDEEALYEAEFNANEANFDEGDW